MIKSVFSSLDHIVYTSDVVKDNVEHFGSDRIVVLNCTFKQTKYGSIIVSDNKRQRRLELYPSAISHITFKRDH